jgi:hypothetical protein
MADIKDLLNKLQQKNKVTPKGLANFPKLDTPDTKFNAMGDFKTGVRLDGEDAQTLKATIDGLFDAAFEVVKGALLEDKAAKLAEDGSVLLLKDGKPQKDKNGKLKVLETADRPYKEVLDDDGNETGEIVFNFKTAASYKDKKTGRVINRKVTVVDAANKPVTKTVFGGSEIRVNFDLSPFYTAIGVGVSLRMNGVRVITLRTGGRDAASMFGDAEDGYTDDGVSQEAEQVEAVTADDGGDGL